MSETRTDQFDQLLRQQSAELEQARACQAAIGDVLRVISESPGDLEQVFETITEHAMRLIDATLGGLARYDGELMHMVTYRTQSAQAEAAVRAAFPRPPGRDLMMGRAVLDRAPSQSHDVLAEPHHFAPEVMREAGFRNVLAVPLLRGDACLGVVAVGRPEPGSFADHEVSLLQTFASQAVIAIENARLFNETNAALERQTATTDVLRVIGESMTNSAPVFEKILDSCESLFGAEHMGIVLLRDDGAAEMVAQRGQYTMARTVPRPDSLTARTIRAQSMLHIPDSGSEPDLPLQQRDFIRRFGNYSLLAVPMIWEGEGVGSIHIARVPPRAFSGMEIDLLKTFADQAVIAIQNARLFRETNDALQRQTAVSEILRVTTESPNDVAPTLSTIADNAVQLCDAASASLFLIKHGELRHITSRGPLAEQARSIPIVPIDRASTLGRAVVDRRVVNVDDMQVESEEFPRGRELALRLGHRSTVSAPLMRKGEPFGAIVLRRRKVRPFSERDIALLRTFGDQAAIALESVRLFRETEDALEQQTATADILKVISSSPTDLQPVFNAIAARSKSLCHADFGAVILFDGQLMEIAVAVGIDEQGLEAARRIWPLAPDRDTISGRAILEQRPVQSRHLLEDPEFSPVAPVRDAGLRSGLSVPMVKEGQCIGAITVMRREAGEFPQKLIHLFQTFADQAVIAIENARLFRETREALERQTATAEVLRAISASVVDTKPVFEKILDSCQRLFAMEEVGIFLINDEQIRLGAYRGDSHEAVASLMPRPLAGSATALAVDAGEAVYIADTEAVEELPPGLAEIEKLTGHFSIVIAPMLLDGRAIGTIVAVHSPPQPFSEADVELLSTFADQAVIAIENARLFREIRDKSRELEVANEHKSEFLANMSHELRTPLNAIIGFSEVLRERLFGDLNEKQDDYLKDIHNSGKHLLSLINDILDLSKIEAGRMELDVEAFDIEGALVNALTLIRERAQQHGIELGLAIGAGLPPFRADPRKFKQIMLNLLSNAVKFTPDGGRIDVRASIENDALIVDVQDTGIGIAEDDQQAIFEQFRQAGGDYTNKQEGTGLGLTLCKRMVELHGGSIRFDSVPGEGTTFTFSLPQQP